MLALRIAAFASGSRHGDPERDVDTNLQGPLKKLAEALHRAIEESSDVEEALATVRDEGFQAFLLLEVTVALQRPGTEECDAEPAQHAVIQLPALMEPDAASQDADDVQITFGDDLGDDQILAEMQDSLPMEIAPADREYLRQIRIRID